MHCSLTDCWNNLSNQLTKKLWFCKFSVQSQLVIFWQYLHKCDLTCISWIAQCSNCKRLLFERFSSCKRLLFERVSNCKRLLFERFSSCKRLLFERVSNCKRLLLERVIIKASKIMVFFVFALHFINAFYSTASMLQEKQKMIRYLKKNVIRVCPKQNNNPWHSSIALSLNAILALLHL